MKVARQKNGYLRDNLTESVGMQPLSLESKMDVISTEVYLNDGRKLTVSMNRKAVAKIDPDIHEIFYDVPCMIRKKVRRAA